MAAIHQQSVQLGLIVAADSQIDPAIWQYELKQNSTGDGVV